MILGVGLDLTPIDRIERLLSRYQGRFQEKVFTVAERAYCGGRARPAEHYAARFAAKEAVLKALGVPPGLSWHELEVSSEEGRPPRLLLSGEAARVAAARGVRRVHLSLTHAGGQSAAVVILEADGAGDAAVRAAAMAGGGDDGGHS